MGRSSVNCVAVVAFFIVCAGCSAAPEQPSNDGSREKSPAAANVQPASDWPRWRGPNADGVADGRDLPLRWSQTENICWSVKLPGWGTSSPVVYGQRVFVTS